jgi:hypothetical protein
VIWDFRYFEVAGPSRECYQPAQTGADDVSRLSFAKNQPVNENDVSPTRLKQVALSTYKLAIW